MGRYMIASSMLAENQYGVSKLPVSVRMSR
jgi:hypothetical protein